MNSRPKPDTEIQDKILSELEDGPKSFNGLKSSLYGCEHCGRYDNHPEFHSSWTDLHKQQLIHLTIDRKVAIGPPTGLDGDNND